jgi:uncharacterized membrane protein
METSQRPRRTSPLNLTSAFALFKPSKELVMNNLRIFGPLYAVSLIFMAHAWIWQPAPASLGSGHHWLNNSLGLRAGWNGGPFPTYATYSLIGLTLVWLLIVVVMGTITQIMTQAAQLNAAEGKSLSFSKLWRTTKELGWRMVKLYVLVGLSIVIGLVLLIIPGLIMIRRYFLAPYVLLDNKDLSAWEAMKHSAELSKPYSGSIWRILGVMLLIGLIGIIPFIGGLIAFVLGSLYSVAPALRYQELKRLTA